MAEFPQLPIHVQRWLSELPDLTPEEHGLYFLTIMQMWLQPDCGISNDPEWLRKKLRVHPQKWRRFWPFILSFMTEINGRLYQKTLCEEREYLREKREKGQRNANKRWEIFQAKALKNIDTGYATQHEKSHAPTPTPTKIDKKELKESNGYGILESKKPSEKKKPRHGSKTKDGKRIWFDRLTTEWSQYAEDYRKAHNGIDPPMQWNETGSWFNWIGEMR